MKRHVNPLNLTVYALILFFLFSNITQLITLNEIVDTHNIIYSGTQDAKARIETLEQASPIEYDEPVEYGMLEDVVVTYYCAEQYPHICNAGPPYSTATGNTLQAYRTCAVDPKVIPLGSEVTVIFSDGTWHTYVAHDTGGAIKGSRIDLAVATHSEAMQLGRDIADVYWREPTDD